MEAFPEMTDDIAWLEKLLNTTFFVDCSVHGGIKNIFCIHCCASLCSQCTVKHCSHRLLQIRRYLYHDVIRLEDMKSLVDCSYVKRYTVNGFQAMFLNPQARPGSHRDIGNCCQTCKKALHQSYRYCCIACKVGVMPGQFVQQPEGACVPNKSSSVSSSKVTDVSDDGETCSREMQKSTLRRKKGNPRRSPLF